MLTRDDLGLFLNLTALAYSMLLIIQFALSAYRELLDSHYVWFIVWAIPLPLFTRLVKDDSFDALVYTVIYAIVCLLAVVILLLLIFINWSNEGSFYLGLSSVDGGFTALWTLVVTLLLELVAGGIAVTLLVRLSKHQDKTK